MYNENTEFFSMNKIHQKTLKKIIGKYLKGIATPEEAAFLDKYYSYFDREEKISDTLSREEINSIESRIFENIKAFESMKTGTGRSRLNVHTSNNFRKTYYYAAAAVLILLCIGGIFLLRYNSANDIGPGGYKASLTLNDGSVIALEEAGQGIIATQGKTFVIKNEEGLLAYDMSEKEDINVGTNTITTPLGGEYRVTLPDGTKAWLNAASSIKYPTAFTGSERIIEITGEVYLEVSKDAAKPFIIKVNDISEIKVLGTHLNINAYPDEEAVRTTLLEGSVQVRDSSGASVTLSPGQQSSVGMYGIVSVQNVDVESVVAWKNGVFQFNSLSIDEIMRQISRWYKVEVIYQNEKLQGEYSGIVSRNTNLSEVLDMLELSGIKCRMEEGRLIILN